MSGRSPPGPRGAGARTLILVRHARPSIDPERPAAEWALSPEGRAAAAALGPRLAPWAPGRMLSSPEPKALETARCLARALGLDEKRLEVVPGLREQDRTGVPFFEEPGEFERRVVGLFRRPDEPSLGPESAAAAERRFTEAVRGALERRRPPCVALVTHGTVMSLFLGRATGLDPLAIWRRLDLPAWTVLRWPEGRLLGSEPSLRGVPAAREERGADAGRSL